jgi:ATP-dependent exoDNAse (exonuclease V) beta subunit
MTTETTQTVHPFETIDVSEAGQNDEHFFSVTTILKALSNPALEYWAIKRAAQDALDRQATWNAMLAEEGATETIKWLCKARYRSPKLELGADQLGSVVHKACEYYALSGQKPDRDWVADMVRALGSATIEVDSEVDVVGRMLNQFDAWLQRFQPEYTAAEMPVFSERFGYAGSLDAILTLDGVQLITDYKTRREPLTAKGEAQTPYAETALQLSAYRHADLGGVFRARRYENPQKRRYYLLSPTEKDLSVKMPPVNGGLCIILTPQSCEAYPIRCDQEVFEFFLYTFEAWRWLEDVSKRVVGDVLLPSA